MTLRERLNRQVQVRVWQVVGITMALSATWATGIYGTWRYFDDRDHVACVERNELRSDVRQAFEVTFEFLETIGVEPSIGERVLAEIDRSIPVLLCP